MRVINDIIESCDECPYGDYDFHDRGGWRCHHPDIKERYILSFEEHKKQRKKWLMSTADFIPDWCLLDDKPHVRVGLTLMIARQGKVLLGERTNTETADGEWAYPGGRMDFGEDPIEGIIRELFEETGMIVKKEDIVFLRYENEPFPEQTRHYVSLVFFTDKAEGEPQRREPLKCARWRWFDPENPPENTFAPALKNIKIEKNRIKNS
jgi:8-oxo-dGTP diphosphatase